MAGINGLVSGVFADRNYLRMLLKLALPVMIQNFLGSFLNMVDTVMVGRLGEFEIAAVGIANQYFFFYHMILIGICSGCGVFISQFWGKRDITNIRRFVGLGIVSSLIVSLIFVAVGWANPAFIISLFNKEDAILELGGSYLQIVLIAYLFTGITFIYNISLRSVGNAVLPMLVSISALCTNVVLNYILIFGKLGPALGVRGAAIATVIARIVETIILIAVIYSRKTALAASLKELTDITAGFVKKAYAVILPALLNDVCWGLASVVYLAAYGRIGSQAVAVIQICNTIHDLFFVVMIGLCSAASVMIGNSIGADKEKQSRSYARKFTVLAFLVGLVLGAILAATAPQLLKLFNVSPETAASARFVLYTISAVFIIRSLDIMFIVGIFRGGGDTRTSLLIEGCTMWFIGVPLTVIAALVLHLPVHLVYAVALTEEFVKCILCIIHFRSGKWVKNLTYSAA